MTTADAAERADLLEALRRHRALLRQTVRDLTDEGAARRTTVSDLSLGGILKHVASVENAWCRFIEEGPSAMAWAPGQGGDRRAGFSMAEGDTLAGLLAHYDTVAERTDRLVETVPSLDEDHPLPEAPWYEKGARRTFRRVFIHVVAETAQHAGHADIIRESLDGAKTMG